MGRLRVGLGLVIILTMVQGAWGQESVSHLPILNTRNIISKASEYEAYNRKIDTLLHGDYEFRAALADYLSFGLTTRAKDRRYEGYFRIQELILKDPYSPDYKRRIRVLAELTRRSELLEDEETESLYTEAIYALEDHWILTFLDDFLDPDGDSQHRLTEYVGGTFATILVGALLLRGQFARVWGGRLAHYLPDFTSRFIRKMFQPIISLLRKTGLPMLGVLEHFVGPTRATTQFGAFLAQGPKWEERKSYLKTPRTDRLHVKMFSEPLAVAGLAESGKIRKPSPYFDYLDRKTAAVLPISVFTGMVGQTYAIKYSRVFSRKFAEAVTEARATGPSGSLLAKVPEGVSRYAGKVGASVSKISIPGIIAGSAIGIGLPILADYAVDALYLGLREKELKKQMDLLPTFHEVSDVVSYREAIKTWVVMSERISFDQVPLQNEYQKTLLMYQRERICGAYSAPVDEGLAGYKGLQSLASDIEHAKRVDLDSQRAFDRKVRAIAVRASEVLPQHLATIEKFEAWLNTQPKTVAMNNLMAKIARRKATLERMIVPDGLKDVSSYYLARETMAGVDIYREAITLARKEGVVRLSVLENLEAQAEIDGPNSAAASKLLEDRVQNAAEYHLQKDKYDCYSPWEIYEMDLRAVF